MRFAVVSIFPQLYLAFMQHGVFARALDANLLELKFFNPREYTQAKHGLVDDKPYGGGPGMVMMYQPLRDAINAAKQYLPAAKVVYLSPQGHTISHAMLHKEMQQDFADYIFICGRYEGIDERVLQHVDACWSIGDYVLTGGELASLVVMDAMARLVPGVLGSIESAQQDSFVNGLLDYPHYTRPQVIDGMDVPSVLLNGDHLAIAAWRQQQQELITQKLRPDILKKIEFEDQGKNYE